MAGKLIPAAEARKRMEAAESSLGAYKSFLQRAGLETRAMRQQIDNLLYELDGFGVKRTYEPAKIDMFGGGEYESLLTKYVELLGEYEALKKTALQTTGTMPPATQDTELHKDYESLKADRDQLANALQAEKEKRAKAGRRPRIKPEVIKEIRHLHGQGLTQTAIAEAVGYSVFTVNRVIHGILN